MSVYSGPERRNIDRCDVEYAFKKELENHELREVENIKAMLDEFKAEAFPDGADRHKQAHQAMIDAAKAQADFFRGLKQDIAKRSLFGILQILLFLVCAGLAAKFGIVAMSK